ncbi:hypothetical protein HV144_13055 [Citrobacter freundii]|nr:hypothetical protein [Citrobacter freundii]
MIASVTTIFFGATGRLSAVTVIGADLDPKPIIDVHGICWIVRTAVNRDNTSAVASQAIEVTRKYCIEGYQLSMPRQQPAARYLLKACSTVTVIYRRSQR